VRGSSQLILKGYMDVEQLCSYSHTTPQITPHSVVINEMGAFPLELSINLFQKLASLCWARHLLLRGPIVPHKCLNHTCKERQRCFQRD
jgi:hypothetical protein